MKTIVITGGTSDIGVETIRVFHKNYNIIFTFNKNIKKAKKIEKTFNVKGIKLNLENVNSINNLFKKINKKKIVCLVHIASEQSKRETLDKMQQSKIIKLVQANCLGTSLFLQKTIKLMKKNQDSNKNIIMISSQSAKFGGNKISIYSASKAYIDGLNLSLSKELPPSIKINNITLGKIATSRLKKSFTKNKNLAKDIPLGRLGEPYEVAMSIKNIIERFSYLTGADIKLTGGR